MTLKEALTLLADHNKALSRKRLYLMLFEPGQPDVNDQKVKNIFYNRPIDVGIWTHLCSDDGFLLLSQRISEEYFRTTGNRLSLYERFCGLVRDDPYIPESGKAELLSSCYPEKQESLSRFLALCILCANNNTMQERDGIAAGNGRDYGINLHTYIRCLPTPLEFRLWKASQRDLLRSRMQGRRFSSFSIIQSLLPKGYIAVPRFEARGMVDGGAPAKLMEICHESTRHIAVIGDGGIGKTTFLHQIMLDEYMEGSCSDTSEWQPTAYRSGRPIPFFIELNRCPANVREWYDDSLQKTNFITRYIGQLLEGHLSLTEVGSDTLASVEKEFQRHPEDGSPRYLLLLDGFNEVRPSEGHSIRSALSNEISVLGSYPNIRIITTSRETQAAYFASAFQNVRLIGLEESDILAYLHECGFDTIRRGLIKANKGLMECLRIPLNLCMFCADGERSALPETQGEIFHSFFHRDGSFYNIRRRADDTRTNVMDGFQTAFILDFILPFIGWSLEDDDAFSASGRAVHSMIDESLSLMEAACSGLDSVPYKDFGYDPTVLVQTAESFRRMGKDAAQRILDCIHGYLGLLYQQQSDSGAFAERNRYSFCHHQFRDYFSAMWDIHMLALLSCMPTQPDSFPVAGYRSIARFVNGSFWRSSKTGLISQILMEHRNRPALEPGSGRWRLPEPATDEQRVLKDALCFCRGLAEAGEDSHFLLQNILSSMVAGRGELSGEDLHGLDFRSCSLFNIRCSRTGRSNTLSADFRGCHLYEGCFEPERHKDIVIEFVYHGRLCYTLDRAGCIKCWDVLSGKMEFELEGDDPCGLYDQSPSGFLRLSPDRKWLAAKIQSSTPDGIETGVRLTRLSGRGYASTNHRLVHAPGTHKSLDGMFFTDDSESLLMLCDKTTIYCYGLDSMSLLYSQKHEVLMKGTILSAQNSESPVLAFTGDYDPSEWTDWYTETYLNEEDCEDEDEEPMPDKEIFITCHIYELACDSGQSRELYCFNGMDGTTPTAEYIPGLKGFLLYNHGARQIELFDCTDGSVTGMFSDLVQESDMPPSHFHPDEAHHGGCYIMYPDVCYLVDLERPDASGVIMKYPISGVAKLLSDGNTADELYFRTGVRPTNGRFIVTDDSFVYEWDSDNDLLLPRYNVACYEASNLICDSRHGEFVLVHQNNGLSIFGGDGIILRDSIAFQEEGYNLTMSCLEPESRMLALAFTRPDHEKMLLLDLGSGEQGYCFSTHEPGETILSLCFSRDGKFLLIVTQYACHEFEPARGRLWETASAEKGERYVGGSYLEDDIEIAVVPHRKEDERNTAPRCIRYVRRPYKGTMNYKPQDYYLLPELSGDLYRGFVFQSYDYGIQGTADENGMQDFWVTRGFFYPPDKEALDISLPALQYFSSDGRPKRNSRQIRPFQMVYFRHVHALRQRYKQYQNGSYVSYAYLEEDAGQAVFMENMQNLFYCPDYKVTSYGEIWKEYGKGIGSYGGTAGWSFIIPWNGERLVCCYEGCQLAVIDARTGAELELIEYTPGMAVYGCDFRHAVLESELKEELRRNGGRV